MGKQKGLLLMLVLHRMVPWKQPIVSIQIGSGASKETEQQAKDAFNKIYSTFKFTP